jgi:transcriptional regulator with PAS, ATPase and Fis domain
MFWMPVLERPFLYAADSPMAEVYGTLEKALDHAATVLIEGESGTGKDALACWLHYNSRRREAPLTKINFSAMPIDLIESELFGYERGAFTGASGTKRGKFELAEGGTLVLDEIASVGTSLQSKLLEAVESKAFFRLGGSEPVTVDARIIALSSVPLARAVEERTFRGDLFFRLNLITVTVPPLRERPMDLPGLTRVLLDEIQHRYQRAEYTLTPDAQAVVRQYSFPGNVRELRNGLERAILGAEDHRIRPGDLPEAWRLRHRSADIGSLEDVEREHIRRVLDHTRGRKQEAADILGITRKTLLEKRKKYGFE